MLHGGLFKELTAAALTVSIISVFPSYSLYSVLIVLANLVSYTQHAQQWTIQENSKSNTEALTAPSFLVSLVS